MLAAVPLKVVVIAGQTAQNRADRGLFGEFERLGHHQAAGGFVVVFRKAAHVGGVFGVHLRQDRLGVLVVELSDDVGLPVAVQLVEDLRRLGAFHALHQVGGGGVGSFVDQLGRQFRRDQRQHGVAVFLGQVQQFAHRVAERQRFEQRGDGLGILRINRGLQLIGDVGLFDGGRNVVDLGHALPPLRLKSHNFVMKNCLWPKNVLRFSVSPWTPS